MTRDFDQARGTLVQESRELLAEMEAALLGLEGDAETAEMVNAAFRAAHTIKGSAGLFGLTIIVSFTQVMESVLDLVRSGLEAVDPKLVSTLLRSGDYIGRLVDAIEARTEGVDPEPAARAELQEELDGYLRRHGRGGARLSRAAPPARESIATAARGCDHWHISMRFDPKAMTRGIEPLAFVAYLRTLGEIVYLHTLSDALPPLERMQPELNYLGFEIGLSCGSDHETLERALEIVRSEGEVRILPPRASAAECVRLIEALPGERKRLGEILVEAGALTDRQLADALLAQAAEVPKPPLGELLVQEETVPARVVTAALKKQTQADERKAVDQRVIKVDATKLDRLIDLVGELVVASEGARMHAVRSMQSDMVESQSKVTALIEQLRDRALDLRMIPIGESFQRFPRVVRDISKELGKQIELVITGADTEIDKAMVDRLSDPLMHIVRNAMDHGIESLEKRIASGKAPQGKLHLHAYHDAGFIVVEIRDDGRGLDPERILAKAVERGLVAADAQLSLADIHQLIFLPGFSTAQQVTSLSGRGVGMDVAKRNVEQLRGTIEIESTLGAGTTFRIRLPLTLAIIDGFQVAVDDTTYVIPLEMVVECVAMRTTKAHQHIVNLRGAPLPYLRLREVLHDDDGRAPRENLVVVSYGQHRIGLVVDRLLGDVQAVIKPVGQLFRGIQVVNSTTILGDGSVGLILDVPVLVARALERARELSVAPSALPAQN